jgi:hypothetical protein
VRTLGWDQDHRHDLDHAIGSDTILHCDIGVAINSYINKASEASNVDAEALVVKKSTEINVERAPGDTLVIDFTCGMLSVFGRIECVRIESLVGNDVVLKESLEILLAVLAEEKGVDFGTEPLKCSISRCEKSPAAMWSIFDGV